MLAEHGLQTVCLGSKFDTSKTKVNVNTIEEPSLFIPKGKHSCSITKKTRSVLFREVNYNCHNKRSSTFCGNGGGADCQRGWQNA